MARRNNPKQKKAASAARLAAGSIYLLRINYNTIRDREVVYTLRYSLYSTKGLAFFKLFMTATPKFLFLPRGVRVFLPLAARAAGPPRGDTNIADHRTRDSEIGDTFGHARRFYSLYLQPATSRASPARHPPLR